MAAEAAARDPAYVLLRSAAGGCDSKGSWVWLQSRVVQTRLGREAELRLRNRWQLTETTARQADSLG